mgnify:CR=1 FL=1
MINFQKCFAERKSDVIEYNGMIYRRYFPVKISTRALLRFQFTGGSSKFEQAIVIVFPRGFSGKVQVNEKNIPVRKTAFPKLNFWESTSPKTFEVEITDFTGEIKICNGSDPTGTKEFCKHLSDGCAMIVKNLTENQFRCYCNDHQLNDDCTDLVFDLQLQSCVQLYNN